MPDDKKVRRKKKTYLRAHPYTILTYLSRFTYLLIIPLLQHLLFQPQTLAETIASFGVNILFVLLLIFAAAGNTGVLSTGITRRAFTCGTDGS